MMLAWIEFMGHHFTDVTELPGLPIPAEQLFRMHHKYTWAADRCRGLDVAEVACGAGPGLGLLGAKARSVRACDISSEILAIPRIHYGNRYELSVGDAGNLPWASASLGAVLLFEAIYYLPDIAAFLGECRRVLRPGGRLLLVSANPDLYDFAPSPYSIHYYGVEAMACLLQDHGFDGEFFGLTRVDAVDLRQRVLRPIKRWIVSTGLMPRTMQGKEMMKRLVFGAMDPMPLELHPTAVPYVPPETVQADRPDRVHKVIYCDARKRA